MIVNHGFWIQGKFSEAIHKQFHDFLRDIESTAVEVVDFHIWQQPGYPCRMDIQFRANLDTATAFYQMVAKYLNEQNADGPSVVSGTVWTDPYTGEVYAWSWGNGDWKHKGQIDTGAVFWPDVKQARQLLRESCPNFLWMIWNLADSRGIARQDIQALIQSGEYGLGKDNGTVVIRKNRLHVRDIPKKLLGIDKHDLLQAADPVAVFEAETGIELKGKGRWRSAPCPFHEDSHPSFHLLAGEGGYDCKGCGARGGNVIDFIRQLRGLSFPDAISYLAERYTNIKTGRSPYTDVRMDYDGEIG